MENRRHLYLLLLPAAAVLVCFLAWPLMLVVWESLFVEGRLSHGNYLSLFVRKLYRESLYTSLGLSVSTAALGTALGLPISYAIHRSRKAKGFLMALTSVPLTFSGLVVGFAFIVLLGTSGFFTLLLKRVLGIDPL